MNKKFDDILQKRMDRKDFIKHVGMGVAVLTGFAGVVKFLKPESQLQQQTANRPAGQIAGGYGASAYGGPAVSGASKSI